LRSFSLVVLSLFSAASAGRLAAEDVFRIGSTSAPIGSRRIPVEIGASNDKEIQGFSISIWYPTDSLAAVGATYAGTVVEPLAPEYFNTAFDAEAGNLVCAVLFEISAPFDLVSLPPSTVIRPVAVVLLDVFSEAAPGTVPLTLADSPAAHPIRNTFVDMGTTILPSVQDGTFTLVSTGPRFRRGYVNADLRADISDAIFLLEYVFRGGRSPTCKAAGDANGDQSLDVSDMIYLLGWIFMGRASPPAPFLDCGEDPETSLSCDVQAICG
jgi:hypothetical protein